MSTKTPIHHLPQPSPGRRYRFHTMVKPAGALCTPDCPYCIHLQKTELLGHEPNARIDHTMLEQHVLQYIEEKTGEEAVFFWEGVEPGLNYLCNGLKAFYARVMRDLPEIRRRLGRQFPEGER